MKYVLSMKKKACKMISIVLIVLILSTSALPIMVSAAKATEDEVAAIGGTTGDCTWTIENGTLTISGNGAMADYDYNPFIYTDFSAPWIDIEFTSAVIEDGVTYIGEHAFSGCVDLTSVTIGNSATSIAESAFYDSIALSNITVDKNNTAYCSIDGNLYNKDATTLIQYAVGKIDTSFDIPDSVKVIGNYAFYDCINLISVNIPDSVNSIGLSAFEACSSLTYVDIPDSVTSIGDWAFYCCFSLTSANIPNSVTSIGDWAFAYCYSLASVNIPDPVTNIGKAVFKDCFSLSSMMISDSVKSIDPSAFYGCISLSNITVDKNNTEYCSIDGNLYNKDATILIRYAIGKTDESFDIPDSVKVIGDNAFYDCFNLNSVTIPDSVVEIAEGAFDGCSNLTSVKIGNSVISIGTLAFQNCSSLTSVIIPDSVTEIAEWAFGYCSGLTSVTLGNSVKSIGACAFNGTGLTSITIPDSVTCISNWAFFDCTDLSSVTIPASVTEIGYGAFGYFNDQDNEEDQKIDGFTITGYEDSAVQTYANENGFKFIIEQEDPDPTEEPTKPTEEPTKPTEEPTKPTEKSTDPTETTIVLPTATEIENPNNIGGGGIINGKGTIATGEKVALGIIAVLMLVSLAVLAFATARKHE